MTSLYRYLLQLYPAAYQGDFSEEMLDVLQEAATAATKEGHLATLKFHFRETTGLLVGSIDERLRFLFGTYPVLPLPWRRFAMRCDYGLVVLKKSGLAGVEDKRNAPEIIEDEVAFTVREGNSLGAAFDHYESAANRFAC